MIRFTSFYGNLNDSLRKHSWKLLRRLAEIDPFSWILMGDLNEVLSDDEIFEKKLDQGGSLLSLRKSCQIAIFSLPFKCPSFTWTKGKGSKGHIKEHIDKGFMNKKYAS